MRAWGRRAWRGGDGSLVQVLSLYLLMLCFFVLLYHMSRVEEVRTQKVAASLTSTFASTGRPTRDPAVLGSAIGDALGVADDPVALGDMVRALAPLAAATLAEFGEAFEARLPAETIFVAGTARLRDEAAPFLNRVADALAGRTVPVALVVEVRAASVPLSGRDFADAQPLALARAGRLAAYLIAQGAPPHAVAAGLDGAGDDGIRLLFRLAREPAPTEAGE